MRLRNIPSLTASLLLGTVAFAQSDAADSSLFQSDSTSVPDVDSLISSLSGVLFDAPGDGNIYARGNTWKAEFGPQGAVYVPFLGSDAPRNFPVRFQLASATVGGVPVELSNSPEVRRSGHRVIIDHGSILEVYDIADESIEQSFILSTRENSGEIVVRMNVDSDLAGETAGRGLRFAGQHGGVNYGEAFAFDNAGRQADVMSRLDAGQLELRVPASFPIEGNGQLVIDPVMTSFIVDGNVGQRLQDSDIAFDKDAAGGSYLVVWEREFSATDHDVYSAEIVKATGQIRNFAAIDVTQDDYRHPRVANNDGLSAFMTVCEVYPQNGGGLSDIVARLRSAGNDNVGGPIFVNDAPGAAECFTPDIGGDSVGIPGGWCVVYSETIGAGRFIRARSMSGTGAPLASSRILSTGTSNSEPTISESSGDDVNDRRYNVAWTRNVAAFNRDVEACQVAAGQAGITVVTPRFSLGYSSSQSAPAVSSLASDPLSATGERPWVVASVITASNGDDVLVQVISGGLRHASKNITFMEGAEFTGDYQHPAVACTGNGFVMTYASQDISGSDHIFMNTFFLPETATGAELAMAERRQRVGTSNNGEALEPQLVSDWESGLFTSDEGRLSFTYDLSGIGGSHIRSAEFEAYSTRAYGTQYCSANRNSTLLTGWLALYGGNDAGDSHVALGTDLPAGQTAFMLCSQTAASVNMPGGSQGRLCLGGTIGRLYNTATQVLPSGAAVFFFDSDVLATPSGTVAAQVGETWHYQVWHRDNVSGAGTSNFTNAVRLEYQ